MPNSTFCPPHKKSRVMHRLARFLLRPPPALNTRSRVFLPADVLDSPGPLNIWTCSSFWVFHALQSLYFEQARREPIRLWPTRTILNPVRNPCLKSETSRRPAGDI